MPLSEEKKNTVTPIVSKEEKTEKIKTAASQPNQPTLFSHPPFLENQCESCHDSKFSQKLTLPAKELCFSCHDDFTKNKKIIHYPVSEGLCIECHDPHQSQNKFILKKAIPQVCFSCHEEEGLKANPAHEGQSLCMDCHNPHASNEEKLMK